MSGRKRGMHDTSPSPRAAPITPRDLRIAIATHWSSTKQGKEPA
jgi:hypothetical protein